MICPSCFKANQEGAKYCAFCSASLVAPATTVSRQPTFAPVSAPVPQKKHNWCFGGCVVLVLVVFIMGVFMISFVIESIYREISESERRESNKSEEHFKLNKEKETSLNRQKQEAQSKEFALYNNFDYLKDLSQEEERLAGILVPPKNTKLVTTVKGIPLYESECRRFKEREVEFIVNLIYKLPQNLLETPPKGILSICYYELGSIKVGSFTNAFTSGPYIYFDDPFFKDTLYQEKIPLSLQFAIFVHEYVHVLQYYYLHYYFIDLGSNISGNLEDKSTLLFDFSRKVGWGVVEGDSAYFENDIQFFDTARRWVLRNEDEAYKTTDYGKEGGPVEDMADTFGFTIAGQPQIFSAHRVEFVTNFLGQDLESLVKGIFPQYPSSKVATVDIGNVLEKKIAEMEAGGKKLVSEEHWSVERTESFEAIVNYYRENLPSRGFEAAGELTLDQSFAGNEKAEGIYKANEKVYLVSILGRATTTTQQRVGNTTGTIFSTVSYPNYIVTLLTFE